jgi:hypothetical protein
VDNVAGTLDPTNLFGREVLRLAPGQRECSFGHSPPPHPPSTYHTRTWTPWWGSPGRGMNEKGQQLRGSAGFRTSMVGQEHSNTPGFPRQGRRLGERPVQSNVWLLWPLLTDCLSRGLLCSVITAHSNDTSITRICSPRAWLSDVWDITQWPALATNSPDQ